MQARIFAIKRVKWFMPNFETRTYGKWILSGEHSVLRGAPALVFPLYSRSLNLSFQEDAEATSLDLKLKGKHGEELQLLFWGVLEKACELKKIPRSSLKGRLTIESFIPVGAGMGASAAFCVAMTRWFQSLGWLDDGEVYEFARQLENLFHGESSGVDVAVVMQEQPLYFLRNGIRKVLNPTWQPQWYISYSGQRGVTSECVQKVKNFIVQNPEQGELLDKEMSRSVELANQALAVDPKKGLPILVESINTAAQCFLKWGLTEGSLKSRMDELKSQGAIAVKPTGSGNGGYILSLWSSQPPPEIFSQLIPIR